MKYIKIILATLIVLILLSSYSSAEQKNIEMDMPIIKTSIGEIAYQKQEVIGTIPIVFLHGVYYDHNLWNYQISRISDHTTITIDMPLHGQSKAITNTNWNMDDCSNMLIELLDSLGIEKCYAVGHSWGSMTILRAASQNPDRFIGVGFCNMPLKKGGFGAKLQFGFQHIMLPFRGFYTKQVAKAMFGEESRIQKPEIVEYLELSMSQLSNRDIRKTDKAVISNVNSGSPYLEKLTVPALAIKGKDDYVPTLETIETKIVEGKHSSPLEQPEKVMELIYKLTKKRKPAENKG